MKKTTIILLLLTVYITAFSQVPPNLMAYSPKVIDSIMNDIGGKIAKKDYNDLGQPIISYEMDYNFQRRKNSQGNAMVFAIFVFGVSDKCTTISYTYGNKNDLSNIVDTLDKDDSYTRKKDAFGWNSNQYNYEITIHNEDNIFTLTYRWLPKAKKQ
jgi:hypothetical protein